MRFRKFGEEMPPVGSVIVVRLKEESCCEAELYCYTVRVEFYNGEIELTEAGGEQYATFDIDDCIDWCYAREIHNI